METRLCANLIRVCYRHYKTSLFSGAVIALVYRKSEWTLMGRFYENLEILKKSQLQKRINPRLRLALGRPTIGRICDAKKTSIFPLESPKLTIGIKKSQKKRYFVC